jgi:rhamnulokinase
MPKSTYLAADLGASGGRVLAGHFDGRRLALDEVHRFANGPVQVGDRLHWNLLGLWQHVQDGLRAAATRFGASIQSVGVDTWGVDYGLLGPGDELVGHPYCYRDGRTRGILERAFSFASRREIFEATGLQFMEFNTAYQLLAMRLASPRVLDLAESLLLMPDLFHWMLTGEKAVEETNASTTQLYDPRAKGWATSLIERFELPQRIFGPIVPPGTRLGPLLPRVREATGLGAIDVVLPGTHDTASAVVAVPKRGRSSFSPPSEKELRPLLCYISSGTWSLMGVEVPEPVITNACAEFNFTNEGGVGGTTRLLKNIAGLWLVQECRRNWAKGGRDFAWDALVREAESARPLAALINPDDPRLVAPQNMPETIADLCRESGQAPPDSPGGFVRCALESLALRYRQVLGALEQLTASRIETIHIVGGGSQNDLLSQLAADACGRRVVCGPVEATAIGNCLVQAIAAGEIASVDEGRRVVRESFEMKEYEPQRGVDWDAAAERFAGLTAG